MWVTGYATWCCHYKQLKLAHTYTDTHSTAQHTSWHVQQHPLHMIYLILRMALLHSHATGSLTIDAKAKFVHTFVCSFTLYWCEPIHKCGLCHVTGSKKMRERWLFPWSSTQQQTLFVVMYNRPAGGNTLLWQTLNRPNSQRKDLNWWHNGFLSVSAALWPSQTSQWQDYSSSMWHRSVLLTFCMFSCCLTYWQYLHTYGVSNVFFNSSRIKKNISKGNG